MIVERIVSEHCQNSKRFKNKQARVAELEDALDLGSSGETRAGSSPVSRISWVFTRFPCVGESGSMADPHMFSRNINSGHRAAEG